jgi:hypothetical protein
VRTQSFDAYIRTQGISAAVVNMALNPLLAWLLNPGMRQMTLAGERSILVDLAVTSVVLCLLVSLCAAAGLPRAARSGGIDRGGGFFEEGPLRSHPPRGAWALGLAFGIGSALVSTALILALFRLCGARTISFRNYAILKAAYTGLLGCLVARGVLIRQLPRAARP